MKYITVIDEYLIGKFQILLNFLQKIYYLSQVEYYRIFIFINFIFIGFSYIAGQSSFFAVAAESLLMLIIFTLQTLANLDQTLDSPNMANFNRYNSLSRVLRLSFILFIIYRLTNMLLIEKSDIFSLSSDISFLFAQYIIACDNLPKDKRKSFWENFDFIKPKTVTEN